MVLTNPPGQQRTPGTGPDAKKIRLIAIIVIIIIVIAVIAVMLSGGQRSSGALSSATFQPASDVSSGQATQETAKKAVDFILDPGDPVSCGLTCRQMTATITNAGTANAHNVCISLRLHNSKEEVIGLNGADTLQQCIGDLDAGQKKSEPVTINADCGVFAMKCIKETLTLQTEITSDEATVRFPDKLLAV
jgi:flagellar basal body-associated protein FliL